MNIDSGYDIKAHTAAKYITVSPKLWLGHAYIIAMNKDVWERLTDSERDAFRRAAENSYEKLGAVMDAALPEQIRTLEADGAVVRMLRNEEVSAWENMTMYREIQDAWVRDNAGLSDAHEVLESVRAIIGR